VCDILIVVGHRPGVWVQEGAAAAGLKPERLIAVPNLAAAQAWLRDHAQTGDAILFENDLPDLYA